LHEAGVKLDVTAGRGAGAIGALFAAVDGSQRLWEEKGFWRSPQVRQLYPWRPALRVMVYALFVSTALVGLPLAAMAAGLVVFPIDFVLKMAGLSGAGGLSEWYVRSAVAAFSPAALPTWLPRLVVLVLGVAAQLKQPARDDLGRRYTELLSDNLGQPGFRELLIAVHDLDARRDLVFALVAERRRRDLIRRSTSAEVEARRAEVLDLSGLARDHLADAIAGSLAIPIATDPHAIRFTPDAYWRGETHHICDRPGSLIRLVEELGRLEVEQIILVSSSPESPGPHTLSRPRLDARGRLGDYLQSSEAALVRDAAAHAAAVVKPRLFIIRPSHNPLGPFDFAGGFDDRSDRRQPLAELVTRGYQDAYHQFIEPVVGASGDRVGQSAV
jgi:hypothetical protein